MMKRLFARFHQEDHGRVTFSQGRIFVLPTKRGFMFLGTVALMLLMSLNDALSLGFIVTFLWFGVIAATLVQTFKNLWGVSISPIAAGHTFAGGLLTFTLHIESGKEAREGLTLSINDEVLTPFDLSANETRAVKISRKTVKRGWLPLGRMKIESESPLGLWRAWGYARFPLKGIVFPAPEVSPPPLPYTVFPKAGGSIGAIGNEDLAGLREYQKGDPLQRIAWKAVARGGGWFTKTFEGGQGCRVIALHYSHLPHAMPVEARLSRLTAWVVSCARSGQPFSLSLPPDQLPLSSSDKHEHAALSLLALYMGEDKKRW